MSTKAGQLLWNRKQITLNAINTIIDTGLRQANTAFGNSSDGEPSLGVEAAPPGPVAGTEPASRVQVIPLNPIAWNDQHTWTGVIHGEPFVDPATGTVKVAFTNLAFEDEGIIKVLNVLFWNPHTSIGPGEAHTYGEPPQIT